MFLNRKVLSLQKEEIERQRVIAQTITELEDKEERATSLLLKERDVARKNARIAKQQWRKELRGLRKENENIDKELERALPPDLNCLLQSKYGGGCQKDKTAGRPVN